MQYPVVITHLTNERTSESCYIATVPGFPAIATHGADIDGAITAARNALFEELKKASEEGKEIPRPASVDSIVSEPSRNADFVVLLEVPPEIATLTQGRYDVYPLTARQYAASETSCAIDTALEGFKRGLIKYTELEPVANAVLSLLDKMREQREERERWTDNPSFYGTDH